MSDVIRVHVIKCGKVGVDLVVPTSDVSKSPVAYTGLFRSSKRRMWIPVFAYLIENPTGNILVDSCWSKDVRINPMKAVSAKLLQNCFLPVNPNFQQAVR